MVALPGAIVSNTVETTGGALVWLDENNASAVVYGSVGSGVAVGFQDTLFAIGGGTALSATDNYLGTDDFIGGVASDTTVSSGGTENVSAGGIANYTTVQGDAFQYVSSGGTAIGTVIDSGGQAYVQFSATMTGAVANFSGQLHITDSGAASGTTVNSGGYDVVSVGGTCATRR